MNVKVILVGATMLGAAGGYAWSLLSPAAPAKASAATAGTRTPVTASVEPSSGPYAEDFAWSTRGSDSSGNAQAKQQGSSDKTIYYAGCNEVRAIGKAPLYEGQPGYREEMDGDGDGIACEPIRPNHR